MPSEEDDEYVTLGDAAQRVGISPATLDRWARQGRIRSEVADDGRRVVLMSDVVKISVITDDPPTPDS